MKVCFFTGTRAEYGILKPLLKAMHSDNSLEVQLLVSGTHLSTEHGLTLNEIERDGFSPDAQIAVDLSDNSSAGVCSAMGDTLSGTGHALQELSPDLLIVLGDRYEALACASAATVMGIPIAHIHGGEITLGAIDDAFRHAITKLAHLHFTATRNYRHRVIQMGESPERTFNVGSLGVENVLSLPLMSKAELESDIRFTLGDTFLLCTFHPPTRSDSKGQTESFFAALDAYLSSHKDVKAIITGANADPGGVDIDRQSSRLMATHPERIFITKSLGLKRYLSAMKWCSAVVGNSSSGIIEAPSMGIPTINIGDRQEGRDRADSIIDCAATKEAIGKALDQGLSKTFRLLAQTANNPYYREKTTATIVSIIKMQDVTLLRKKTFHDITLGKQS